MRRTARTRAPLVATASGGGESLDAVWTYEAPCDAVASIRDHLAFYPERADAITLQAL